MTPSNTPRCPVCQAAFRSVEECPRCGAALRPLMRILLAAHALRQAARRAIRRGEYPRALALARAAARLHATRAARQLVFLARWMDASAP